MKNIKICPSILSANFACLMDDVERLEKAGIDILHVDVMDGHFVPNISFGVPVLNNIECDDDADDCIKYIHNLNCKCGVAIKPGTDVDVILPYIDIVDMVLVMTVEPGFGGQIFMPDMLEKVRRIRSLSSDINIQVDGGINSENAKSAVDAGANLLVAGSAIFREKDFEKAVKSLKYVNIS